MGSFWNRLKGFFTGGDSSGEDTPGQDAAAVPPAGTAAAPGASAPAAPVARNPYAANEAILGLSAEEFRKRALKIVPWRTAWIGRVDTIPPQSDERTALIDRGLILRGFLTREQLAEIHRVGDLWLKHHEAHTLASAAAAKTAEAAVEQRREERRKRKEEKQRLAAERRQQRVEDVARRRREDIIFLGRGVSGGLADRRSNIEALQAAKLPVLSSPADVAKALGLTIPRLRWLCFHQEAAEKTHYHYFEVPKRSGGKRLLSAPQPTLKQAQAWILENILEPLPTELPAHGFIKGRSTVSNAAAHQDRDVVVNLDLKDFFPTITFRRVKGVFQRLGYSPSVATVLALLCTESPRRQVDYDGKKYWVAVAERGLPQGACTSPALSNQVARKLDRRLRGRMAKLGWEYTRYADDLTFSAPAGKRDQVPFLMAAVRHVAEEEGFALNPNKGRVQRVGGRQSVTGIVVNEKLSVPREEVRRLRAILHQARTTGLEAQNRENRPNFEAWLHGKIAYVCMVDRAKGLKLLEAFEALRSGKRASAGS
ncbi:reverse transcriptase family protein [Myxococcus sp. RHSTA-1-4]|uniref:reverse transcriptase family protein n=1 Tax=Myxococcus sp. RHSTA-1-4 TaxID=2874601 RepID=UPI001CBEF587|nr:reverse transcriptase family protein [Myxococcus sp. RHSTA-1-4]MBZ4422587.1 reverse transcriptase family protein [Myxococcus sp. RHSTA-1-4]